MNVLLTDPQTVPEPGHRIIGFYGASGRHSMCHEFGIVTAPADRPVPDAVYDMAELQNSPNGGTGVDIAGDMGSRPGEVSPADEVYTHNGDDSQESEDDSSTSDDSDRGYDNDEDVIE